MRKLTIALLLLMGSRTSTEAQARRSSLEGLRGFHVEILSDSGASTRISAPTLQAAVQVRLLIHRHPELKSVIELRVRKEDGASV